MKACFHEWPLRVPERGRRLGGADGQRFEILEELGGGAMGRVFRAWDEELQRGVALKFLLPRESSDGETPTARLKQEARAVARLDHESLSSLLRREKPGLHRKLELMSAHEELLEGLRHTLAKLYLDKHLSIAEVSYLLGYANPTAFHRAFKRWTGVSPEHHRHG